MDLHFFHIVWGLSIFIFLYTLIIFLITLIEKRKELYPLKKIKRGGLYPYPTVCIIVPFLNEEKSLARTLNSLVKLDYPKEKLEILAINDNSTDNSFNIAKEFEKYPTVRVFTYPGERGKYSSLNYGIEKTNAQIIGCLDADSIVSPSSLKKIVAYFQDKEVMAVAAAPKIDQPKTIFQYIIQVEFLIDIFSKKCLSLMDSMSVIPGSYSFFRKSVLEKIGGFREAHKTEDIEITMRLQKNNFKLANAIDVPVYTIGQDTFKKLYKQRLRWITGYWKNLWDYKVLLKKAYGDLSLFLSLSILSILLILGSIAYILLGIISSTLLHFSKLLAIDFNFIPMIGFNFNLFFLNINPFLLLNLTLIISLLGIIILSRKLSFEKSFKEKLFIKGFIFFIFFYFPLMIIWTIASFYSILFKKKITWK